MNERNDQITATESSAPSEPINELTPADWARQDEVDNAIYLMVAELIPAKYSNAPNSTFDMRDWVQGLRDRIEDIIFEELHLPDSERDAFEMEFYPYVKLAEAANAA